MHGVMVMAKIHVEGQLLMHREDERDDSPCHVEVQLWRADSPRHVEDELLCGSFDDVIFSSP